MECTKPTIRYRANFKVTSKNIYTPDVTVELSGVEMTADNFETSKRIIEVQLSELYDAVKKVAESKGYASSVIEQN